MMERHYVDIRPDEAQSMMPEGYIPPSRANSFSNPGPSARSTATEWKPEELDPKIILDRDSRGTAERTDAWEFYEKIKASYEAELTDLRILLTAARIESAKLRVELDEAHKAAARYMKAYENATGGSNQ